MAMNLTGETTHDRAIGPRGMLLQQLLEASTTTQSQMARLVHVDTSTISNLCLDRWLPGKSNGTREIVLSIADVLLRRGAPWAESMAWVAACGYSPFPPGEWPVAHSPLQKMEKGLRAALIELATLPKGRQVEVLRGVLAERRAQAERSASA